MTTAPIKSAARRRAMALAKPGAQATTQPRAVIYLRMSMDRTGEGAGLERQEQACRALCLARGWDVVAVIDDTISATDYRLQDRAGWQTVVKTIEAGEADLVVAWHLDRVTRSMKDLESLIELAIERNIGLATATGDIDLTTDVGRMVARILAAVATAEGERKAARQVLANDQRVEKGLPNWVRRPFGFNKENLEHVPDEAAAIKQAYHDVLKGKSLSAVAREWNEAGFRTSAPDGEAARPRAPRQRDYNPSGLWNGVALRLLLRNPRNMGVITLYGEVMGKAAWEPIIDEPTWRKVDKLLADRERPDWVGGKLANLLSGIAHCGVCGGPVRATKKKGIPFYLCAGVGREPGRSRGHTQFPIDYGDGLVVRRLIKQMTDTNRPYFHPVPPSDIDVPALLTEEARIEGKMNELAVDQATNKITRQQLHAATATLREELAQVQAEIAKAGSYGDPGYVDIEYAYYQFDEMELSEQRSVLVAAFEFIRLLPRGKGRPKAGEAIWRSEHLATKFTPAWS
ncbi:recombinase family protein [Actinoplanes regularis]|uniref:Site-specific DNA recombinase n=1 Tax=Actinoplanes regularis TaxID=52697 RepID=A0A239CGB3_9ACTN|nr:recombinase family protein [Actinoplanes regularis]GIE89407.1 site-specific recombinase DNA invertase Pin [Actinoplanes regularis]SNS19009.1 Site-specific DNA recombinase [Actinoplanes regularis]